MKTVAYATLAATLTLSACASGPVGHPHGYGYRDSPGRPYPAALPLPGYDYRFRPDPQGLGRDLPPWRGYAHAPQPIVAWPHDGVAYAHVEHSGYAQSGYVAGGETYSVREGYSEETYVDGGYVVETQPEPYVEPYSTPNPIPYEPAPPAPPRGRPYEADSSVFY